MNLVISVTTQFSVANMAVEGIFEDAAGNTYDIHGTVGPGGAIGIGYYETRWPYAHKGSASGTLSVNTGSGDWLELWCDEGTWNVTKQ